MLSFIFVWVKSDYNNLISSFYCSLTDISSSKMLKSIFFIILSSVGTFASYCQLGLRTLFFLSTMNRFFVFDAHRRLRQEKFNHFILFFNSIGSIFLKVYSHIQILFFSLSRYSNVNKTMGLKKWVATKGKKSCQKSEILFYFNAYALARENRTA